MLIVPLSAIVQDDVADDIADNGQLNLVSERVTRRTTIKAGKKDTVASIARRYRVSTKEVAEWNGVGTAASFHPGQQVVVYVQVRTASRAKHGGKAVARKKASSTKKPTKTANR